MRGPSQDRTKLMAEVVTATIVCGSSAWKKAVDILRYTRGVRTAYHLCALRVCAEYRTVSGDGALVIAGMIPIVLRATEGIYTD